MEKTNCDCNSSNGCDVDALNVNFFTSLFGSLMDIYKDNKHYFWPIYFIIVYLRYISKSRTDEKRLPIFNGTYSNEYGVRDVPFLNDVIKFVNESGVYIIAKGATFLHPIFRRLSFILFIFSFIFPFIYPHVAADIPFSFFSFLFISTSLLIMFPSSYGTFYSNILIFFGSGRLINPCNVYKEEYNEFFVGLCYYCKIPGKPPSETLHCCCRCQLVAYCSKTCMDMDWSSHKYVCKEFPLVNGNNALQTTGPWKEHIGSLYERAARLRHGQVAAKAIFRNPRVCYTCQEAHPDRLTDCECACVSYCSKKCARVDKKHKEECSHLNYLAQLYYLCVAADLQLLRNRPKLKKVQGSLTNECRAYPMSLLYALQSLPKHQLGRDCPLEDFTTLEVHVVTSSPIFNSKSWEVGFMHQLPQLKQLNVVFVMQGKAFKPHFFHNIRLNGLSLLRCKDCEVKNRVITYSVQQKQYHMFFSSSEYTDPDVVVVFDNTHEMSLNEEEDINSEISYRNMTYSRGTVLVLTDATMDLVKQGAKAVNSAQPVDHLVSPRINQNKGNGSERADLDSPAAIVNDKYYFTCLKRK